MIINYYPAITDIKHAKCTFCNQKSDYRTFRRGKMTMQGNIYYIKMCKKCFIKAKHNIDYCKKIYQEVKTFAGK